jgi:hypothetical protein
MHKEIVVLAGAFVPERQDMMNTITRAQGCDATGDQ